jgi:hypothetical protein
VDFLPDSIFKISPVDLACMPLLLYHDTHVDTESKEENYFLSGLVIQPTGEFRDGYRRVGAFHISGGNERSWFEGSDIEQKEMTLI